jgi:hypothetical protein
MAQPSRSIFEQRRDQTFPRLDPSEIERVRRFGDIRVYVETVYASMMRGDKTEVDHGVRITG